jgi:hypothetical protein
MQRVPAELIFTRRQLRQLGVLVQLWLHRNLILYSLSCRNLQIKHRIRPMSGLCLESGLDGRGNIMLLHCKFFIDDDDKWILFTERQRAKS